MNNRLQFIHHGSLVPTGGTDVFETREEALLYIQKMQPIERPSLYGEPMVMRYKNADDEKSPHIMLAIGSVGDGAKYSNDNRVFIIDTHKTEEEISEIGNEIEAVAKALTLYEKDSNTLDLTVERSDSGTTISGDVILSDYEIYENKENGTKVQRDNILQATDKGLFTFVDLKYDEEKNEFTFFLNESIEKFQLPTEKHIVSGEYDIKTEEIKLFYNDDYKKENPVKIDVNNLIEEWKTEEEDSDTPIVLVRERVKDEEDGHKFQDVLKGDIRINKNVKTNILKKSEDGKSLFVKGTADNIKYSAQGDETVYDVLTQLESDVLVNQNDDNIIIRRPDGLYASVDLKYDSTTNTLQFKNTKSDGYQDIKLNGVDIFTAIWYDADTESLNLQWKDSNGELQIVSIKISQMFEEWKTHNEEHSVKLVKTRSVEGETLLSADVNVSYLENNILQDLNHELYVNGIAENIKYGEKSTVREQLDTLNERMDEKDSQVETLSADVEKVSGAAADNKDAIESEVKTREEETSFLSGKVDTNIESIERIDGTIGTGFTNDPHENITAKFENEAKTREDKDAELETSLNEAKDALSEEVSTRESQFDALATQSQNNTDKIGTGFTTDVHDNVTYKFEKEVQERKDADEALQASIGDLSGKSINFVENTESVEMLKEGDSIKSNVKISGKEDNLVEIIKDNLGDGVYASVDVLYDEATNVLTLVTNKGKKDLQLVGVTAFDQIKYNPLTETVDIKVFGREEVVRIPVGAIIREWEVKNDPESVIELELGDHVVDGKDKLSAKAKISTKEDNILENKDGALYVSNSAITTNAQDIKVISDTLGSGFTTDAHETVTAKFADEAKTRAEKDSELETTLTTLSEEVTTKANQLTNLSTEVKEISDKIGEGFSTDAHETVSYKFEQEVQNRQDADTALQDAIDGLNGASEQKFSDIDGLISALNERTTNSESDIKNIENLIGNGFTPDENNNVNITGKFKEEQNTRKDEDAKLQEQINEINGKIAYDVEDTDSVDLTKADGIIKGDVKVSTEGGNTILVKADGLYSKVAVSYDDKTNELVCDTNGVITKTVVNGIVGFGNAYYKPSDEAIVIEYIDKYNQQQAITIDTSKLANEFDVDNSTDSAVVLTLSEHIKDGKDKISADVRIADPSVHPDNILVKDNGALYVSNAGIVKNETDIANLATTVDGIGEKVEIATEDIRVLDGALDEISRIAIENQTKIEALANSGSDLDTQLSDVKQKVSNEVSRLDNKDKELSGRIDVLTGTVATNADAVKESTKAVKDLISDEKKRAELVEDKLDKAVSSNKDKIASLTTDLSTISANTGSSETKISSLQTQLDNHKTDNDNKFNTLSEKDDALSKSISDEAARAIAQEGVISGSISAEKTRAEGVENTIVERLNGEIERAKTKENALESTLSGTTTLANINKDAIAQEKQDRKDAIVGVERAINDAIKSVKVSVEDTQTLDLTIGEDNKIKGDVIIAKTADGTTNGNIILASKGDDKGAGIFASVDLSYDAATNELTFTASGNAPKSIKLNAGSIINGIDYDSATKELVVRYQATNDTQEQQVRVSVADLINDWSVKSADGEGNYGGAVALVKERLADGSYELSGRVQVSTLPSNILVNDNGNLYVDGSGIKEALDGVEKLTENLEKERTERIESDKVISGAVDTNKESIDNLQKQIGDGFSGKDGDSVTNTIIEINKTLSSHTESIKEIGKAVDASNDGVENVIRAVGLKDDGTFNSALVVGTNYISGATSIMEALRMMDQAIKEFNDRLDEAFAGSDTYSVNLTNEDSSGKKGKKLYGNVRLAKATSQTEDIENVTFSNQDIIDGADLHNLLKIVHQEGSKEENSTNGLYYDGSVDYGSFDDGGNIDY